MSDQEKQATVVPEVKQLEEEKDLQERIDGFNKELRPLLGKFELGLSAIAFIKQGQILAQPTLVSMRGKEGQAKSQPEESDGITKPE